jgi:hypothetical protein
MGTVVPKMGKIVMDVWSSMSKDGIWQKLILSTHTDMSVKSLELREVLAFVALEF